MVTRDDKYIIDKTATWTLSPSPSFPLIKAKIQTDSWTVTSETRAERSGLLVLENSLLILVCVAYYEIMWYNGNKNVKMKRLVTNNEILFIGTDYNITNTARSVNGSFTYESMIQFHNLNIFSKGAYTCGERNQLIQTVVDLSIQPQRNIKDYACFLQGGFDKIHTFVAPTGTKVRATFIYTLPLEIKINQSIVNPDGTIHFLPSNVTDSYRKFKAFVGLLIETKILTDNLRQTTITFETDSITDETDNTRATGTYTYIITTQLKNGTSMRQSTKVFLDFKYDIAENIKQPLPHFNHVLLKLGKLYEVQMHMPSTGAEGRGQLSGVGYQPQDDKCLNGEQRIYEFEEELAEACGVFGVAQVNDGWEVTVHIHINATRPCTLNLLMQAPFRDRLTNLIVSIFDGKFFDSVGNPKIFTLPYNIPSHSLLLTNEFVTLRCIVPPCMGELVGWCITLPSSICNLYHQLNGMYYNKDEETIAKWNQLADPLITFSTHYIGDYKWAFDMTFFRLEKNHSNIYTCGTFSMFNGFTITKHSEFAIQVADPIEPTFSDAKNFSVEKYTLARNDKLKLICDTKALPEATITWYRKLANSKDSQIITPNENETVLEIEQPGIYYCNASNRYGRNGRTFIVDYPASYLSFAIGVPIAVAVLSAVGLSFWFLRRRALKVSFKKLAREFRNPSELIPIDNDASLKDQVNAVQYNQKYELDRDSFTISKTLLGHGEFGSIFKGEFKLNGQENTLPVAIKIPKDQWSKELYQALLDELKIMSQIHLHVNVLQLIGAHTSNLEQRQLHVLTEFCENGSLKDYLMSNALNLQGIVVNETGQWLGSAGTVDRLLKYAYQAASGMEHLAAANIIHRDLALRNLLLSFTDIVKISDFGMSRIRALFYQKKISTDFPLPIRWMAIESLTEGIYTKKSDVWSFGIVLWEIFSCGKTPYPDEDDENLRGWLRQSENNRMKPPSVACDQIYQLMLICWKQSSAARPSFSECKGQISRILEQKSPEVHQAMLISLNDAFANMFTTMGSSSRPTSPPPIQITNAHNSAIVPESIEGLDTDELISSMETQNIDNEVSDNIQMQCFARNNDNGRNNATTTDTISAVCTVDNPNPYSKTQLNICKSDSTL